MGRAAQPSSSEDAEWSESTQTHATQVSPEPICVRVQWVAQRFTKRFNTVQTKKGV